MKTTFNCKVVFETDKYKSYNENGDKKILTLKSIKEEINSGTVKIEMITGDLGTNNEPTIVIKNI